VWPSGALTPYQAAVRAATETTAPLVRSFDPDVVVADILTVAANFAAQMEGRRWATLIPHVLPTAEPGLPPYSVGARLPRSPFGSALWGMFSPVLSRGEERGRREMNEARRRVGLAPLDHTHGGISRELALVATFPQLEYPRHRWHRSVRVTGPLMWEAPFQEVDLPAGDEPLVLIAPSTAKDPEHRMLAAALDGLSREPVRVIATTNRRAPGQALAVPPNARVVDWLSYAKTMRFCSVVVCHAGHGTVVRALASGVPVVGCPVAGDMAENAARVAWAGCGVSLPRRLVTPRGIRLAVRKLLAEPHAAMAAQRLQRWGDRNDGGAIAAEALEAQAAGAPAATAGEAPGVGLEPTT
jgi:UDP:flavonoid glycosyltransferase YjiC (YdhE family)